MVKPSLLEFSGTKYCYVVRWLKEKYKALSTQAAYQKKETAQMAKCLRCGKTVNDSAVKCPYCGNVLKKRIRPDADENKAGEKKKSGPSADTGESRVKKNPESSPAAKKPRPGKKSSLSDDDNEFRVKGDSPEEEKVKTGDSGRRSGPDRAMMITLILVGVLTVCTVIVIILRAKKERENVYDKYIEKAESYNAAIEDYNMAVESYNTKANEIIALNAGLAAAVDSAQALLNNGETPYDEGKRTALSDTVNESQSIRVPDPVLKEGLDNYPVSEDISKSGKTAVFDELLKLEDMAGQMGSMAGEVRAEEGALVVPDYSEYEDELLSEQTDLEYSYAVNRQITAPDQSFVTERLNQLSNVAGCVAITEESNPDEQSEEPQRPEGYLYTVYFTTPLLGTENLEGDDIIKAGIKAGGSIEVYSNAADAISRNDYYSSLDTEETPNSFHQVLGTMAIRFSDKIEPDDQEPVFSSIKTILTDAS